MSDAACEARFVTADGFSETREVTRPLRLKWDFPVLRSLRVSDVTNAGEESLTSIEKRSYIFKGFCKDGCALYVEET